MRNLKVDDGSLRFACEIAMTSTFMPCAPCAPLGGLSTMN